MSLPPAPIHPTRPSARRPFDELLHLSYLSEPIGPLLRVGVPGGAPDDHHCEGIFAAHCLLYHLHQQGQSPSAILCAPQLRDGSAIGWRKLIQGDPELRDLPFFVVGDATQWPERAAAQAVGIDDCFEPKVATHSLEQRISFLKRYKPQLNEVSGNIPPQPCQRISPLKRVMDILVSGILLLILAPLLIFYIFWLRIGSRGPVFVKLPRVGRGYQLIDCLAFRGGDRPHGAWWRHIPCLWNVLRGDLSLVGNRPLELDEAQTLTTDQWAGRFLAPAGLTGPWMVAHLRGQALSLDQERDLEVAYAQNPGLGTDWKWLLRTLCGWCTAGGHG
jgi:lipopolysaccharide/colanic/teichoic acid biosynthesis glycosyltransferase